MSLRKCAHVMLRKESDWVEILVPDVHGEYPIPELLPPAANLVFDGWQTTEVIEALEIVPKASKENFQEVSEQLSTLAGKVMVKNIEVRGFSYAALLREGRFEPYFQMPDMIRLYSVRGKEIDHKALVEVWANLIQQRQADVGGDDDYYDYFPCWVEAFEIYALALNRFDLIEQVINTCRNGRYKDDLEDSIPPFDMSHYK